MKTLLTRIALVGGLGLVLVLVLSLSGWRSQTKSKYAAARARATADCRAYRAQPGHQNVDVCRYDEFGPRTPVTVHLADAKLAEARVALSRADARTAVDALHVALSDAQHADRFGTPWGTVLAAGIIDSVLDVLDAQGGSGNTLIQPFRFVYARSSAKRFVSRSASVAQSDPCTSVARGQSPAATPSI